MPSTDRRPGGAAVVAAAGDGTARAARTYTIGELALEFDVTPRTLRHYEEEGLIAPERRGQTRVYSRRDRGRLTWVLRGRRLGFSLADIREMLDLYDVDPGHVVQLRVALRRGRERIAQLERRLHDIEVALVELRQLEMEAVTLLRERGEPVEEEA